MVFVAFEVYILEVGGIYFWGFILGDDSGMNEKSEETGLT